MISRALIGSVIKKYREQAHLSQEVMSGLAGMDRAHLSRIECGLRAPSVPMLFQIASALNMPPHELVEAMEKAQQEHTEA